MRKGLDVILLRPETYPSLSSDIRDTILQKDYNLPESVKELLFAAYAKAIESKG